MRTRAAVAFKPKAPLEIVEIEVDKPRDNEVLHRLWRGAGP
jgi:Zn-dependent alcohol dehydrogenase